jgi:putative membrane protein
MMGYGMMGWGNYGWIGMIVNLIITVAVIVGIVWLVIWLVRRTGSNGLANMGSSVAPQSPHEILQARYARGDITREQYLEILEDLS